MAIEARHVPLGSLLPWFSVVAIDGEVWDTSTLPKNQPVLVIFLCNHSPYVLPIESSLGRLVDEYKSELTTVGICSNDTRAYPVDDEASMKIQVARAGFSFPYCRDVDQRAARAFGASCTPEFFLYDRNFRLAYHGQYDSSRPDNGIPPSGSDLRVATNHVVASEVLLEDQVPNFGCSIKWAAGNYPIYMYTSSA
jgi:hypothetical protein